jgi:integrase/recombinase XerD
VRRGKGAKFRITYIAEGYRPWIAPWLAHRKAIGSEVTEPMFVRWTRSSGGANGGATNKRVGDVGIDYVLNRIRDLAGITEKFTPHDLRRSFATELFDAGADLLMVQSLMGHADAKTTKMYDRRGEAGKKTAVEKFPVVLRYDDL